jgi:TfoX/Sxy family transcriptional regulator of competence genes
MAYDTQLADRVRELLHGEDGVTETRMFGGLAFLVNGNMAVAASGQGGLLLRVDPADTDTLVTDPHAERFVMRERPMNGWLHIDPDGLTTPLQLERWVTLGVAYARSLPGKR